MTPFLKLLRNANERLFGKYYEGPDPPERLAEMVIVFANEHPRATRGDWIEFACKHAGEAYRSAYVRGVEWTERDTARFPDIPPDVIVDAIDPDWRWRKGVTVEGNLMEVVPDEWPEEMIMREQMDEVNRGGR